MIDSHLVTDIPPMIPGEQCWRLPFETSSGRLCLFLRHLPASTPRPGRKRQAVLYFNGARLASAVTVAHRIDGQSWRDDLTARGFDVWALDYLGYGQSDRYPQMTQPATANKALGRIREVTAQVEAALHFILNRMDLGQLSVLAHSWGSNIAALVAIRNPAQISKLALFGPVTHRPTPIDAGSSPVVPAWNTITAQEWRKAFDADVPVGHPPLIPAAQFEEWAAAYLQCDPESATRTPPAVKVPWGGMADVLELWGGGKIYDPSEVRAPTLIVRGEWDSYSTDADAHWLFSNLINASQRRDVKIGMGTHFMFYEPSRFDLYDEVGCFFQGRAPAS